LQILSEQVGKLFANILLLTEQMISCQYTSCYTGSQFRTINFHFISFNFGRPKNNEMKIKSVIICWFTVLLLFCFNKSNSQGTLKATVVKRPATTTYNAHYTSNKKPLELLVFIKLPVGSIKPEGWIKKYLELQRDGLTGKLGEISAWLEKAKGKLIPEWTIDKYGLCGVLPQSPVDVHTNEQTIELIPMGAARLRISAFPVVN